MITLIAIFLQMNGSQHMMDGWGGGFGMGLMVFFWLLVLGLIGTLIWFLIQKGSDSPSNSSSEPSLEILKKRYARREIDEEQYKRYRTKPFSGQAGRPMLHTGRPNRLFKKQKRKDYGS